MVVEKGSKAGTCSMCGAPAYGPAAFRCEDHRRASHARSAVPRETAPVEVEALPSDDAGEPYAEQKPREPRHAKKEESGGLLGKFWSGGSNKDKDEETAALSKTTERKPVVARRRVSTADFWGDLVSPAAALSARARYVP